MILETVPVGPMQANCYVLASAKNTPAVIIDPGSEERKIKKALEKHELTPGIVVNTHGHYDHIGADDKFGVSVYVHKQDKEYLLDANLNLSGLFSLPYRVSSEIKELKEGQVIGAGGIELKVIHMPGHTPGGIALVLEKPKNNMVFTGDSLFCDGIGRTDLSGGNEELLIRSIKEKLFTLPDDAVIYPGHGPSSTIGREKSGGYF